MKRVLRLLSVIVMLAACHRPTVETMCTSSLQPNLTAIDTLMQSQPDSALTLLLDEQTNEPYYQLLLSEALYKNDYAQANRAELLEAMAYFDSIHCPFLSARAHYMNGVGNYEMDSVVAACEEYMKAIQIMEEHYPEKELVGLKAKFMALTYTRLVDIFSDQYLHEQAIFLVNQALTYYHKFDAEPWQISWMLNEIGTHYDMMGIYDSADCYYHKAIELLPDTNNLTYKMVSGHLAFLNYEKTTDKDPSLQQLYRLLSISESNTEFCSRCLSIGEIYYHETIYDSAWIYLTIVFNNSPSTDAKKQAAQWLAEICEYQGKYDEVSKYSDFLIPFATQEEDNSTVKSQLSEMYRNFNLLQFERTHLFKTKRLIKTIVTLTGLIVLFFLLILASHFLFKRKLMTRELKYSAVLEKAKKSIETLQNENHVLKKKKSFHDLPKANYGDYNALMKEGICVNIKQRVKQMEKFSSFDVKSYHSLYLTKKELSELYLIIDKYCPNFSERLLDKYPSLNTGDLKLCRLYLLDLSIIQVAVLLDTDYSSIRKRTNRLKEKTGCIELSQQLKSLFFE